MDNYIIQKVITSEGSYQWDYNSLANLPDLSKINIVQGDGISITEGSNGQNCISLDPEVKSDISLLMDEVFPFKSTLTSSSGFKTYEEGSVASASMFWRSTKGSSVINNTTVIPMTMTNNGSWIETETLNNITSYTWNGITSNTSFKVVTRSGSLSSTVGPLSVSFTKYRYYGPLDPISPSSITDSLIKSLGKSELSTTSTLASTGLDPGKCFLFAVYGVKNLVVRHAGTDAVIDSDTGTIELTRKNGTGGTFTYSWILVPASSIRWNFIITNS